MEATLEPISTHISRKTGRLLGTQATTTTAGMKSWGRSKQAFEEAFPSAELREQPGSLTERPMNAVAFFPILSRSVCHRGTASEAAAWRRLNPFHHVLLGCWPHLSGLTSKTSIRYWYWAPSSAAWLQKSAKFPKESWNEAQIVSF